MSHCTVYYLDPIQEITEQDLSDLIPFLPPHKREQIYSSRFVPFRVQSALAYLLLRYGLTEIYGIETIPLIEKGKQGKPFFPDLPDICFNISHCRNAVACGLSSKPIGVDVQHIVPYKETVASFFMTEDERNAAFKGDRDLNFTRLWSMKESYVKYLGTGIFGSVFKTPISEGDDPRGFRIRSHLMEGYYLSACGEEEPILKKLSFEELKNQLSLSFQENL